MGVDDARHSPLPGTVPIRRLSRKWPIFATPPCLAGAPQRYEADFSAIGHWRLASSSASICASRHRIQAFKRGPLIILVRLGNAQTMCQESILTVVIVALFGSGARSAGKEGPSP